MGKLQIEYKPIEKVIPYDKNPRLNDDAVQYVAENIKAYAEWRKKNSPNTSLGVQFVADSVEGVYKFYEANKGLDVDYFSFRPLESTCGNYYMDDIRKAQAREITAVIEALAEQDSRVTLNFKWHLLDKREQTCTAQWAQIAVNERGEVMYCCHKPYQIVGHIMDDDILEKKAQAGTDMSMCDIPCRMTAPNMFVALHSTSYSIYCGQRSISGCVTIHC